MQKIIEQFRKHNLNKSCQLLNLVQLTAAHKSDNCWKTNSGRIGIDKWQFN